MARRRPDGRNTVSGLLVASPSEKFDVKLGEIFEDTLGGHRRYWRDGLLERGLPVHLVNHLVTMADLHRAGRYDRMSDDVLTLTRREPLSVQEFVKKNAATFTAPAKEATSVNA